MFTLNGPRPGRGSPVATGLPAWRTAMTAFTWAEIPTSNTLSALNPENNAAINPDYPSSPEWKAVSGQQAIITAWCGACYDRDDDKMWWPLQGGHNDYAGNEPYCIALNDDAPTFELVRWPSGAIGNLLTTNDGNESTGLYSDGQPRAVHSYNKAVFVPGVGPFIAVQGNCSWTAAAGTSKTVAVDPDTGLGTLLASNSDVGTGSGGGACFDPTRGTQGSIWWRGAGTDKFCRYDVAANTWAAVGSTFAASGYTNLAHHPDDDYILYGCGSSSFWKVFDCASGTLYSPTFTGTVSGSMRFGYTQMQWVPALGAFCGWDNSSDKTRITTLTPGANPLTDGWTISYITVDGANAVTPSDRQTNGTYGRFQFSPNLNGFVLINSTSGPLYFFALD